MSRAVIAVIYVVVIAATIVAARGGLRIGVDDQGHALGGGERQVDGEGGLPSSALLTDDRDGLHANLLTCRHVDRPTPRRERLGPRVVGLRRPGGKSAGRGQVHRGARAPPAL
jgi:hypothetical protein